ncbi:restriction endonuclease subunit S [Anabaena sp. PCC 7108]|uniref:restriction endonuclease subunit S n=1 Tax=Anabaena sp. PCC 7108 TaxID=163908 RepID=UPI000347CF28|nr:restriction endonuclease subunit S [Anabaena sp. PCC 7108]
MKLETFFEHFDLLAEAPNGVQKLRELILDLAVRGKLVPQDANDEPAAVLLERIKKEKERLVKEGKIKKDNILSPIKDNELLYDLQKNWQWVRLGEICLLFGGYAFKSNSYVKLSNNQVIRLGNVKNNQIILEQSPVYVSDEIAVENDKFLIRKGDILITMTGTKNKRDYCFTSVVNDKHIANKNLYLNQRVGSLRINEDTTIQLVNIFLKSSIILDLLFSAETGTANQGNIGADAIRNLLFPLPPLAEQKRIVTKVDELMKLCDELEARQKKKRETRILINNAALNKLLTADTPETFTKNWQCICDNFDILYSAPENIGKLRQAILQLAVMGKLVPQDANDEPAAVLLERIKKEKEQLVKEGKISKSKLVSPLETDELLFELPSGWEWVRIDDFYEVVGGIQKTPKRTPISNYFPYLRVANVYRGRLDLSEIMYFELFENDLQKWNLFPGDLLIVEGNGSENEIGRCAIWNGEIKNCVHQNHLIRCRPLGHTGSLFTLLFLNSPVGITEIKKLAITTSGLYSLSVGKIRGIVVPLPPLEEQKRIVTKVDKLMKLCDELESKLTQTQTESEKIINAAVKQLLTV